MSNKFLEWYQNKRKLAFCAATRSLPPEIRMAIWSTQGRGGGVYGNTRPEGIVHLINAILEENDMDVDTFDERVSDCLYQSCHIESIAELYRCFESDYSSNYLLAFINGACFQDLENFPDAGLEFAKFTQPRKFQRYEELERTRHYQSDSDSDEEEMRALEYEFKQDYERNVFGHVSFMSDDWIIGSDTGHDIVSLALTVLGIDGGDASAVRTVYKGEFLAAYEIALCKIWMPCMMEDILDMDADMSD